MFSRKATITLFQRSSSSLLWHPNAQAQNYCRSLSVCARSVVHVPKLCSKQQRATFYAASDAPPPRHLGELSGGVPLFFTEQQPDPQSVDENGLTNKFVSVVVQRKPEYTARDVDFAQVHSDLVGSAIIDRLKQTFGGTPSALPLFENGKRPSASVVEQALKQLVNLFLINGFALDGSLVSSTTNSSNKALTFEIRFISPANLWSGQALEIRKSKARNNFVGKAAKVLLSDAGFTVTTNVKYTKTDEITTIYLI